MEQSGSVTSVVRKLSFTRAGLQVGAQFVHAVERVQKERPYGVDLHQGQVVQLQGERSRKDVFRNIFAFFPNSSFKRTLLTENMT